jgi:excisionase family DNA binding protein
VIVVALIYARGYIRGVLAVREWGPRLLVLRSDYTPERIRSLLIAYDEPDSVVEHLGNQRVVQFDHDPGWVLREQWRADLERAWTRGGLSRLEHDVRLVYMGRRKSAGLPYAEFVRTGQTMSEKMASVLGWTDPRSEEDRRDEERGYVKTGRAAALLGVSQDSVVRYIERGDLPAVRAISGHWIIRTADLDAFRIRPRKVRNLRNSDDA